MNWLLLAVLAVLAIFGFIGYKRGLILSVIGTGATIIALVLSYALTPTISKFLQEKTGIDDYIEEKIYASVESKVSETVGATEKQLKETMKKNPGKQEQVSFIQELGIPDFLEKMLLESNHDDGYAELGVDNVYRYISKSLTQVAVNVIAGVLAFVLLRLILLFINIAIRSVIGVIPIVRVLDRLGGIVAGVALGVIIVWVLLFILSVTMNADRFTELVTANPLLNLLNDTNVIMKVSLR